MAIMAVKVMTFEEVAPEMVAPVTVVKGCIERRRVTVPSKIAGMVEMVAVVTVVKPYIGRCRVTGITRIAVIVGLRSIYVPPSLVTMMVGRPVTAMAVMHPVECVRSPCDPNSNCVVDRHRALGLTEGNAPRDPCDQT